jgi:hypothetical protein
MNTLIEKIQDAFGMVAGPKTPLVRQLLSEVEVAAETARLDAAQSRRDAIARFAELRRQRETELDPLKAAADKTLAAVREEERQAPLRLVKLRQDNHAAQKKHQQSAYRFSEEEARMRRELEDSASPLIAAFQERLRKRRTEILATPSQLNHIYAGRATAYEGTVVGFDSTVAWRTEALAANQHVAAAAKRFAFEDWTDDELQTKFEQLEKQIPKLTTVRYLRNDRGELEIVK